MMLKGKSAVVTGCAKGIGRSILEEFVQNGANVWACVRKQSEGFESYVKMLSDKYGTTVTPVYFDLAAEDQIKTGMRAIAASKAPVDILVNNAGITYNALFQMSTLAKMREIFEINYFSQMLITQYITKLMIRNRRGSIISISSTAALDANSGRSIYGASKAALLCSTRAMAEELAEYNIRANSVAPGITDTEMVPNSMSQEMIKETIEQVKLKRIGLPSDIAATVLFLASDLSSYITGQVIRVDGGLSR